MWYRGPHQTVSHLRPISLLTVLPLRPLEFQAVLLWQLSLRNRGPATICSYVRGRSDSLAWDKVKPMLPHAQALLVPDAGPATDTDALTAPAALDLGTAASSDETPYEGSASRKLILSPS